MGSCIICGNEYGKSFQVTTHNGKQMTFDSLECAIQGVALECRHCGIKIVGHGVEAGDDIFCCAHCAEAAGHEGALVDRA
jgi:hypothetical protein